MKKQFQWVKEIKSHSNPDIDAVASVWVAKKILGINAPIRFEPQNYTPKKGDLVLDMHQGIKGNDENPSCAAYLIQTYSSQQEKEALSPLCEYLNTVDSGNLQTTINDLGEEAEMFRDTGILTTLSALKCSKMKEEEILRIMFLILDKIRKNLISRYNSKKALKNGKGMEKVSECGRVAIIRDNRPLSNTFLEGEGTIVVSICRNNLGIITRDNALKTFREGMSSATFKRVAKEAGEESEWYEDPRGFLFCRGSDSVQQKTPSKVNPKDLLRAAEQFLREYDQRNA